MADKADRQWEQWVSDWRAGSAPAPAPEAIANYVRKRGRTIAVWFAGEIAIGLGFGAFFIHRAITDPDPVEKVAMGLLALISIGAFVASWLVWHDTLRASAETTAAYVALAQRRADRVRRWIAAGWVILIAEVLVLAPWVWRQLYGGPEPPSARAERFAWSWFAGITLIAVCGLAAVHVWARRDRERLKAMTGEL